MRRNTCKFFALLLLGSLGAAAQVIAPVELKDPTMRNLQEKYMDDLKAVGQEILTIGFTYPFYLSRKLDIDEQQQKTADQHSIRSLQWEDRAGHHGQLLCRLFRRKIEWRAAGTGDFPQLDHADLKGGGATLSKQQERRGLCARNFTPRPG